MKKHLNTQFRQFILERIKREKDEDESQDELEEVLPDDISEEPIEDEDEFDFKDLDDEDDVENRDEDEDDLIDELHNRYKKLKKLYEYRLHQRRRTTL